MVHALAGAVVVVGERLVNALGEVNNDDDKAVQDLMRERARRTAAAA